MKKKKTIKPFQVENKGTFKIFSRIKTCNNPKHKGTCNSPFDSNITYNTIW